MIPPVSNIVSSEGEDAVSDRKRLIGEIVVSVNKLESDWGDTW